MEIKRDYYLQQLIRKQHNTLIKVVTGIRRCGKSYLLFNIYKNYLLQSGITQSHIIEIQLDDIAYLQLRDASECYQYIKSKIIDQDMYYLLIDEVQMMDHFEDVLNSCLHIHNLDTYVTGSNAKFLSSDIVTSFRGRGDEIRVYPLSFAEYYDVAGGDKYDAWIQYYTYGGLPYILYLDHDLDKENYLKRLFQETYMKDIIERNHIQNDVELEELISIISSSIGSLTNPTKLANTFASLENSKITAPTIKNYLNNLEDAFLIDKAERYDVKGKKYINTPYKYYFTDLGLRNARLNFRQLEETHLMENAIYNELKYRGYSIDVGVVETYEKNEKGNNVRKNIEIDFVVNRGSKRYYLQSAYALPTLEKREQEKRPLLKVNDSFKKIIVVGNRIKSYTDDDGILMIDIFDFLLNNNSLDL